MKKTIRLTESDLHNIIKGTVNNILIESNRKLSKSFIVNKIVSLAIDLNSL